MEPRSGSGAKRALIAVVCVAAFATACPAARPSPTPTPPAASPVTGGTVTIAYPSEPATLDPFTAAGESPATRDLVRMLMPAFWRTGSDNAREAWLADAVPDQVAAAPSSVEIALRADAVWSDGVPITVADLVATWRRARAVDRAYERIAGIDAVTAKRARIRFNAPFAGWRALFSEGLGVIPAHVKKYDAWTVAGGPYVLAAWHRGLDVVLRRNPRAWGAVPLLDTIRIEFVPVADGALELLRRGSVDVVGPYADADWTRRAGALGAVSRDRGATTIGLLVNTKPTALRETAVRRALATALDRRRMANGLVGSEGSAIAPVTGADPAAARRALDAAGWRGSPRRKNGVALSFTIAYVSSEPLAAVLARALQFQADAVGFDVRLVALDLDVFWRDWVPGRRFQSALVIQRRGIPLDAGIPLATLEVSMTVRAGTVCGVRSNAGGDGPLWNADRWSRAPCA